MESARNVVAQKKNHKTPNKQDEAGTSDILCLSGDDGCNESQDTIKRWNNKDGRFRVFAVRALPTAISLYNKKSSQKW
jgi:hypothetical protein